MLAVPFCRPICPILATARQSGYEVSNMRALEVCTVDTLSVKICQYQFFRGFCRRVVHGMALTSESPERDRGGIRKERETAKRSHYLG